MNDRPLVTFALFAYNLERFVREAVEGALSQTYSPLEIILSDDCSSDSTFDIMQEMTSGYSGPHKIIINRNRVNLGIGGHVNRIMEMASGELIVAAAGDDVSLPGRCEELVEYWQANGRRFKSIYSDVILIDEVGQELGFLSGPPFVGPLDEMLRRFMPGVKGCSHAWTRDVFTRFGPLLPDTVCEDRVIPMRSHLLGGIGHCEKALVHYRQHDGNISRYDHKNGGTITSMTVELHRRELNIQHNYQRDLACAQRLGLIGKADLLRALGAQERHVELLGDKIKFLEGSTADRLSIMIKHSTRHPAQVAKWGVILTCPFIFRRMQSKNLVYQR